MSHALGPARWEGASGRLEVWYLTATDERTGTGLWVHQETVAPKGSEPPYAHGWTAVFERSKAPVLERFGPEPVSPERPAEPWHVVAGCEIEATSIRGAAGSLAWDLTHEDAADPLYTFPRWAWERELLPGAQVVPEPTARVRGTIEVAGRSVPFDGPGALARIHGHGSAQRWGWLHADLLGEGVLEIVSGTARRPGLRWMPPLAFVQLRLDGEPDWPARSLVAAPRFRTKLRPDGFVVAGRYKGRRLDVVVELPADGSVDVGYRDPDGATATCRNSERAAATVTIDDRGRTRSWRLDGTAHAEVGSRP